MRLIPALISLATVTAVLTADEVAAREALPQNVAASFCSTVRKVVTAVRQQSAASAYCSSYLKIPQSTLTVTSVTGAETTVAVSWRAEPTTTTTTTTVAVTSCPRGPAVEKRSVEESHEHEKRAPRPKPSAFSRYTASAVISSACKCPSIPTGTTTMIAHIASSTSITTTTLNAATSTAEATAHVDGGVSYPRFFNLFSPENGRWADIQNPGVQSRFSQWYTESNFTLDGSRLLAANDQVYNFANWPRRYGSVSSSYVCIAN